MQNNSSDEELMLAYADNDMSAFEVLYTRYKTPIFRYLLRQTKQQSIAEELFQDVWSKIIKARARYKELASFRTFIYQIARNTFIDYYRRQHTQRVDTQTHEDMYAAQDIDTQNEPSKTLESSQNYTRVIDAIYELPAAQRDVFLLKEEAELTIQEIAEILKINPETCKSQYRYARNRLRQLLGAENLEVKHD